jgi:signal peptidase I
MNPALIDSARAAHEARAAAQYARLRQIIGSAAIAVLIALGLRSFVLEPFNIPSESMLPTLRIGDYLFVAKWPYGYSRFSLPLGLPVMDGRIGGGTPERGDVVVFKSPADNRTDFIKRVAGLPGDRVRMTGGRLEVNGLLLPKQPVAPGRFVEILGSRRYEVLDQVAGGPRDDTPLVTVPPGSYFMLGDNRDDSADSRLSIADGGVGMVPAANLVGRAEIVFFSLDGGARLARPSTWPGSIRADRIGRRL